MRTHKNQLRGQSLKNKILSTVRELPPMPQVVLKAREIMADPHSSFEKLSKVLESDQAIAMRVLKLVNSAYYGQSGKISSIQRASVVLGHKTIGELITMAGTSQLLGKTLKGYGLKAGELWRHSLAAAFASRMIANQKVPSLSNDAFTAGLIHDVGKLILDKYILERKEVFQEFMADGQQTFLNAEKEILGFDHSQIAAEVCKSWNIPKPLADAIRYHHYPSLSKDSELAYIVHIADSIAMMTALGLGIDGMTYKMDDNAIEFLDIPEKEISNIMNEVIIYVDEMAEQMS